VKLRVAVENEAVQSDKRLGLSNTAVEEGEVATGRSDADDDDDDDDQDLTACMRQWMNKQSDSLPHQSILNYVNLR
jgi:hypothetical protein